MGCMDAIIKRSAEKALGKKKEPSVLELIFTELDNVKLEAEVIDGSLNIKLTPKREETGALNGKEPNK